MSTLDMSNVRVGLETYLPYLGVKQAAGNFPLIFTLLLPGQRDMRTSILKIPNVTRTAQQLGRLRIYSVLGLPPFSRALK